MIIDTIEIFQLIILALADNSFSVQIKFDEDFLFANLKWD